MADIALSFPHTAPPDRLRDAIAAVALDADLYGLFSEWKTPERLLLTGKGVEAWVTLAPEAVQVTVALPWLFRLAKGLIAGEVADKIRTAIAQAEAAPTTAA